MIEQVPNCNFDYLVSILLYPDFETIETYMKLAA